MDDLMKSDGPIWVKRRRDDEWERIEPGDSIPRDCHWYSGTDPAKADRVVRRG